MGREIEWKLEVPDPALLDEILTWEEIRSRLIEIPRRYHMQTSYYDTGDQRWSRRLVTLRRRLENETSVLCVKAPLPGGADGAHLRGEWELEGDDLIAALPRLVALGAPAELLEPGELACRWQADFIRRAALLRFDDGSLCELALDRGSLLGPAGSCPLCELELELKQGGPHRTLALLTALRAHFGLALQEKSKFARARELS